MAVHADHLIWIDLEMTGLNPDEDVIIEIATIVTDSNLDVLAEGPDIAIHHADPVLARMDEWNTRTHGESGLTDRVRQSEVSSQAAEMATLSFLQHWSASGGSPMCGNSIGQDRQFLRRHMPTLEAFFHYRNLDVSTLKILVQRWRPQLMDGFSKTGQHRALDDIRESIMELAYYRTHVFGL
ncbi:MAG: oligoribonuclease [Pseudomonadota bacterium]